MSKLTCEDVGCPCIDTPAQPPASLDVAASMRATASVMRSPALKADVLALCDEVESLRAELDAARADAAMRAGVDVCMALEDELAELREHNKLQQATLHELHARMKDKDAAIARLTDRAERYRKALEELRDTCELHEAELAVINASLKESTT